MDLLRLLGVDTPGLYPNLDLTFDLEGILSKALKLGKLALGLAPALDLQLVNLQLDLARGLTQSIPIPPILFPQEKPAPKLASKTTSDNLPYYSPPFII